MSTILKMSQLYAPTLKEDPSDADIASAKLLTRAGMIRKEAAGLFTYLPLGMRVLHKIETIIREEMDAHGSQEILMPFVTSADLWRESGRWDAYGDEMMRLVDRHGVEFCLGPTHEEVITDLVKDELKSYKDLPKNLYHIQLKFRDERRPRFGLLRTREFIMKDAYSFDADSAGLDASYKNMRDAYKNIFDRCGLDYRVVQADSGEIGGSGSEEFMVIAQSGECELVYCDCGYGADSEIGECLAHATQFDLSKCAPDVAERLNIDTTTDEMQRIKTPGVHTIDDLASLLRCEASDCAKAFSGKDGAGNIWVVFVPGNYEVNTLKVSQKLGGFEPLTDTDMKEAGLVCGSMGPVNLPSGVCVAADRSLQDMSCWIVGANEEGYHFVGVRPARDFNVDKYGDFCVVHKGDACPKCGKPLNSARGIEVGQIFKLGTKYSEAMSANYMDEDGSEKPFIMGCYGIGVGRTLAAAVEQCHDDAGIVWPVSLAPAQVCVIPLTVGDDAVFPVAEKISSELAAAGLDVCIDDRGERAGVKFADSELIGWPISVVVGKRGLKNGCVEVKTRKTSEKIDVLVDDVVTNVKQLLS